MNFQVSFYDPDENDWDMWLFLNDESRESMEGWVDTAMLLWERAFQYGYSVKFRIRVDEAVRTLRVRRDHVSNRVLVEVEQKNGGMRPAYAGSNSDWKTEEAWWNVIHFGALITKEWAEVMEMIRPRGGQT